MIAADAVVAPVPPYAIPIVLAFQIPLVNRPTLVRLEFTTVLPRPVESITLIPLILYSLPIDRSQFSEDFQASSLLSQRIVCSVVPFNFIPPPSAILSEGARTSFKNMNLSVVVTVVTLEYVVVPCTVRSPDITRELNVTESVVPTGCPI